MIRVLLADDENMVREGVKSILTTDAGIEVVAEAGNGREAVELARAHRPDVALIDIRMPVLDGLGALAELRQAAPATRCVMLTTFDEDEFIARALDAGAAGFLLKASDPRELIIGVRAVADGAAYLSPRVAGRVIAEFDTDRLTRGTGAQRKVAELTPRENEVLGLIASGLSNQEIGRRLHLTEGTVKAHVSAILQRLGVRNRVEAAIIGYQAGLA
ncbi:response regulator [Stackebrandtia nassauensis]|uniref:Two component transcriptional regulator, LuxR family n=1 Tax=Stackebrandtia nassauensis (strain DSM 44728 / CIP 108903 / NRRL B-16338 / NBRC 102104 / LLR-40K-21) TaxID=446470 RepID=D3PX01_STANL|nr:response regulator transcription factor [Stackebrandtia nassauensis]ADD45225.1 two component transcriptional regulator, LuxR family [Stackebrandtia nassauensis DSM 44728]